MDRVSLMALIDWFLLPAGFAVEVFPVDKSFDYMVNVDRFDRLDDKTILSPDAPTLRLLYGLYYYEPKAFRFVLRDK